MKYILAIVLMMFSMSVLAQAVNTNGLDEAQRAAVDEYAAKLRKESAAGLTSGSTVKKVDEWVDIGVKIGQAFGGAAKEMSIQVNEFAKTPVGLMTAGLIVWKMVGGVLVHFFGGILVLASGWIFMLYINRKNTEVTIKYSPDKTDIFGRARKISVDRSKLHNDYVWGSYIWIALVTLLSIATIFTF